MPAKVEIVDNKTKLSIDYIPQPVAKSFIEDSRFLTGYFGPLGCGKTTAGVMKTWLYAQAWPGARIAIIRDTMPNLQDTTQKSFFEWLPEGIAGEYLRTPKTFYLRTGDKPAEILFRSMDDKDDVTNVLSLDLAAAWIDEPQGGLALNSNRVTREPGIDEQLFYLLLSRVGRQSGYKPMSWLTGNPPSPSHWLAKFFKYNGTGAPTNEIEDRYLYLGTKDTNRANLTQGYYERLESLFGKNTPLARRFLEGEWIEFAALNPFHRAWIRYWGTKDEPLPSDLLVECGVDPAISDRDTSARSAIVVAGHCRSGINRGRIYVLHEDAGHWTAYETVDRLLRIVRDFKVKTIRIEDVAYQRALKEILEKEMRERGIHVKVDLIRPDGDKLRRASQWSPFVENGTVLFGPNQSGLIECMLSVPGDRNAWDLVDAAGICIRGFQPLESEQTRIPGSELSSPDRALGYATRDLGQQKMIKIHRYTGQIFNPKREWERQRGPSSRSFTRF